MRTPKRLIHSIASCRDCDWSEQDYRKAAAAATEHAKRNGGHTVHVEQGYSYQIKKPA